MPMARYVLLLRGINVGGKTKVPMAGLRAELEKLGFSKVRTHLNSGNALFESDLVEAILEPSIEVALESCFGFHIPVLVRGVEELLEAVEGLPFSSEQVEAAQAAAGDAASLYLTFLSQPLTPEAAARFQAQVRPGETAVPSGRVIYLMLEHSIRECKLFSGMDKLDPRATTRNWNTAEKLSALLEE
jgi:uncharacterized protein (DUF1697 family)